MKTLTIIAFAAALAASPAAAQSGTSLLNPDARGAAGSSLLTPNDNQLSTQPLPGGGYGQGAGAGGERGGSQSWPGGWNAAPWEHDSYSDNVWYDGKRGSSRR